MNIIQRVSIVGHTKEDIKKFRKDLVNQVAKVNRYGYPNPKTKQIMSNQIDAATKAALGRGGITHLQVYFETLGTYMNKQNPIVNQHIML